MFRTRERAGGQGSRRRHQAAWSRVQLTGATPYRLLRRRARLPSDIRVPGRDRRIVAEELRDRGYQSVTVTAVDCSAPVLDPTWAGNSSRPGCDPVCTSSRISARVWPRGGHQHCPPPAPKTLRRWLAGWITLVGEGTRRPVCRCSPTPADGPCEAKLLRSHAYRKRSAVAIVTREIPKPATGTPRLRGPADLRRRGLHKRAHKTTRAPSGNRFCRDVDGYDGVHDLVGSHREARFSACWRLAKRSSRREDGARRDDRGRRPPTPPQLSPDRRRWQRLAPTMSRRYTLRIHATGGTLMNRLALASLRTA